MRQYVRLTNAVRQHWLNWGRRCAYIDLYCSFGRVRRAGSDETWHDGSALAAWNESVRQGSPFAEVHISDLDREALDACKWRLERAGAVVVARLGDAESIAAEVARVLDPRALHLGLLDPYGLGALPFSVIESLSALKRMDMIIHFSEQDLLRNYAMDANRGDDARLNRVVPGWRAPIDFSRLSIHEQREAVFEHWLTLLSKVSKRPAKAIATITNRQRRVLYRLVLASDHKLAHKLWDAVNAASPQRDLFD